MLTIERPKFEKRSDGEYWTCPCCGAKLARVCELTQIAYPSLESKTVAGLKLAAGYKFIEDRRIWIKPGNTLAFRAGQKQRTARQELRQHLRQSIENAERKDDRATVVYNGQKLAHVGKQRGPIEEPELRADQLPAVVLCSNRQCRQQWKIPSVRSAAAC